MFYENSWFWAWVLTSIIGIVCLLMMARQNSAELYRVRREAKGNADNYCKHKWVIIDKDQKESIILPKHAGNSIREMSVWVRQCEHCGELKTKRISNDFT